MAGIVFRTGTFSDPDGDGMLAFQMQLSAYGADDPNWDDAHNIKWDTGKRYVAAGSTSGEAQYSGASLTAGTWYWRIRVWDTPGGVSDWHYEPLVLSADFDAEPGSQDSIQLDPHAPWRIRIREMEFNSIASRTGAVTGVASTGLFTTATNHGLEEQQPIRFTALTGGSGLLVGTTYYLIADGLAAKTFKISLTDGGSAVSLGSNVTAATITAVTTRGPGTTVAVLHDAANPGASIVYNAPGEFHFTLPKDHPQVGVIEPMQTHYGLDFYSGDGWRETFVGLVHDYDATDRDVVFLGIDYLGLTDWNLDERYDPTQPDLAYTKGGSHYTDVTIRTVVLDQLNRARTRENSPVGFITVGTVDALDEHVTIDSTMIPSLSFIVQLLDSHRQGSTKKTRIKVRRTSCRRVRVRGPGRSRADPEQPAARVRRTRQRVSDHPVRQGLGQRDARHRPDPRGPEGALQDGFGARHSSVDLGPHRARNHRRQRERRERRQPARAPRRPEELEAGVLLRPRHPDRLPDAAQWVRRHGLHPLHHHRWRGGYHEVRVRVLGRLRHRLGGID